MRQALGVLGLVAVLGVAPHAASALSAPGSPGAKAAAKCQQTIAKVNAKFLSQRLKRLADCSTAVLSCVQAQPGVPSCITKATSKCRKQFGAPGEPDAAAGKLEAAVVKACGTLAVDDLLTSGGLAFGNAEAACAGVGVAPLASAADVASCLQRLHAGSSEQSFGAELPRAAELTAQGGVSASIVPDLPLYGGCGDCGVPPATTGKAIAGCGAAITKAGATFLGQARSGLDKCATAFVTCAQQKPGDAGCLAKAKATCQKLPDDLAAGRSKLLAALQKKCAGPIAFPTLQAPAGVDLGALACECQQVGVAPVATLDDYAVCLSRQHECKLAALLPSVAPSLDGLLADQGLATSDLLCAPAVQPVTFAGARQGARAQSRAVLSIFGSIKKFFSSISSGTLKNSLLPSSNRGTAPRVGRPSFVGGCRTSPGRSCTWRFPIRKSPFAQQRASRGTPVDPPSLIIGVQRADGTATDDHFEIPLGDTTNDSEVVVDLTYAPELTSCDFQLALAVAEAGEVSAYTTVEQHPHPVPANDECTTATPITDAGFVEVLDTTAASVLAGEVVPSCATSTLSNTVWYQFTAPANGMITADTFGSDYDTDLAIWSGACSDLSQQTCVRDSNGTLQSKAAIPVTQGTTYFIQIGHDGTPADTSALHFAFRFEANGTPPTIAEPTATLVELNSSSICSANNGSAFRLGFDYTDPDGNVLPNTVAAKVHAVFEPSGNVSDFVVAPPLEVTGDGFSGHTGFIVCTFFSADTSVATSFQLGDFSGLSNTLSVKIDRPAGAN